MSAGQEVLCSQGEASGGAGPVGGILINVGQPGVQSLGEVVSYRDHTARKRWSENLTQDQLGVDPMGPYSSVPHTLMWMRFS